MAAMIKLLLKSQSDLDSVQSLPGLRDIALDKDFGLVLINPDLFEYVVRANFIDNLEVRKKISPEIIEAYGDIRISSN